MKRMSCALSAGVVSAIVPRDGVRPERSGDVERASERERVRAGNQHRGDRR